MFLSIQDTEDTSFLQLCVILSLNVISHNLYSLTFSPEIDYVNGKLVSFYIYKRQLYSKLLVIKFPDCWATCQMRRIHKRAVKTIVVVRA